MRAIKVQVGPHLYEVYPIMYYTVAERPLIRVSGPEKQRAALCCCRYVTDRYSRTAADYCSPVIVRLSPVLLSRLRNHLVSFRLFFLLTKSPELLT